LTLLKLSDWLLPNLTELTNIKAVLDIQGDIFSWLSSHQIQNIVVKKGRLGADVYSTADQFSVKGYPVNVIDTTGAGDSFAGGFIYGLANGYSLREAIALANACGALTATFEGPHGNFSLEDALHLIKDNAS
jgi:sugar/nucleoside kinase (ribokinase family)